MRMMQTYPYLTVSIIKGCLLGIHTSLFSPTGKLHPQTKALSGALSDSGRASSLESNKARGVLYKNFSDHSRMFDIFRNRSVVWMVSRCHTLSRREVYADKLKEHIDVDIFGKCGEPAPKKGSPPINLDFRTEMGMQNLSLTSIG